MALFALVDGNNFYVSCERVFRPSLKHWPVVVLSNNDGCCIARSNEAKALNIAMGAPWFEVKHLNDSDGLVGLSANFTLYGDMSDRMMSIAAGLGPGQEIYSIDESFIDLAGVRGDLTARAQTVRERILQWTGIPTGIGIGSTKTLAKLANHIAKTAERKPGSYPAEFGQVCNLAALPASDLDAVFAVTKVGEVWGVGRRIAGQLEEGGILTVLDLMRMDPATVRRRWSVVLERTVRELQGLSCIALDEQPTPKKEIACTRSFGRPVTDLALLIEAVSEFATRAAEKRLKHRAKLESVSGLSQHALLVDVFAKVLADNLGSLVCQAASEDARLPSRQRTCNRAYAAPCLQRLLPRMVMGWGCLSTLLDKVMGLLAANSHRRVPDRSQPRPKRRVKPHPNMAYKG